MSVFEGFNRRYQMELSEEIASSEQAILSGNLASMEEYKKLTAKRAALMYALERHKELLTLMDQANDK